jgi:hypothetical protein
MYGRRGSGRPFWMVAKFGGVCSSCKLGIKKGESIYYYPATKTVLCSGDGCGKQAERDLAANDFDLAQMAGEWR